MKNSKILLLLLSIFVVACSSDSEGDLLPPDDDDGAGDVEVTYTADIRPIITSNCIGCHSNPPTNGAPFSLTTFEDVSGRANRVFTRTNNGTMPPSGKLPQANIDLISAWIAGGTLE